MLVTRHNKEHVIYSDHSRLLLSLSRRADISQEPTHEARIGTKQLDGREALATGLQEGMCA